MIGLLLAISLPKRLKRRTQSKQETTKSSEEMINLIDIRDSKEKFDNRYRLIDKIGGGGFSEVWLAHDLNADMDVALKIYTPNGELDEEGKEDFKREFARLCGLNHSNIIHAIGFGIHKEELPYLAMSVCKNGSAKKLINNFEEEQLWTFIEQVALGLQYLHAHSITHQDIKPDNILINSDGQYLIIDFGISTKTRNTLRKSTKGSVGGGTPWYMSIESWGTEAPNIHARDIWALGAMLFEIITGDAPFGQYGGVTQKAQNGKIPPITNAVSDELKRLIYDCLALNAWDRPNADDILRCVQNHKSGIKFKKPKRYKKLSLGFASVVFIAVACYVIYHYIPQKDDPPIIVLADRNPNDSIYLSNVSESSNIMSKESERIMKIREYDKISLERVISALDVCGKMSVLSDSISSEAKEKGIAKLNNTLYEANKICQHLENCGDTKIEEYGDDGLDAQKKYYQLSNQIKNYMNMIYIK